MLRLVAAVVFVAAGALHFARPRMYEAIMPEWLPAHRELVLASGAAEIAGGLGLLGPPRVRRVAGWWLIATLLAVFPANVNMALNAGRFAQFPEWALWARLPFQLVLIALVRAAMRP